MTLTPDTAPATAELVQRLVDEAEASLKQARLNKWQQDMAASVSRQRRWINERSDRELRRLTKPAFPAGPLLVRSEILQEATHWQDMWTQAPGAVDRSLAVQDLLDQIPQGPPCTSEFDWSPEELQRSTRAMLGKCAGVDGWSPEALLRLP